MAENKRMTISIPAEMEEALTELRKTDRFCRSSYAEIVGEVLKIGVERINNSVQMAK